MSDLTKIATKLTAASKAYYRGKPIIGDDEFDALKDKLKKVDPGHPFLRQVGAPAENTLKKVKLAARMGSLDNAFDADSIGAWIDRTLKLCKDHGHIVPKTVVLQPKLDGLSVQLSYRKGALVMAATRGDGVEGEDVTNNVKRAQGVPLTIASQSPIEVRGEMVVLKDAFATHFKPLGDANARNSAAGTVRRKDGKRAEHLTFIAFDAINVEEDSAFGTEIAVINHLKCWGFTAAWTDKLDFDRGVIVNGWQSFGAGRHNLPYLVDGCVVKLNDRNLARMLGWSDTCPRGAIACKWRGSMVAETVIKGIEHSVGHTGVITPVAIVEPVDCGGVTIRNISLMNWDEIGRLEEPVRMWLGIGSRVKIERAGEVIPRVTEILSAAKVQFVRPAECPSCHQPTKVDGPRQVCENASCPAQAFRTVLRWVKGRGIMHLGETCVDRLMAMDGPVKTIADLYHLTREELKVAAGGYAMADKIQTEIEKSRACAPFQVFGNIGIPGIGETEAAKLCDYLAADDINDVMAASVDAYVAAIGDVRGRKFAAGVVENADMLARLNCVLRVAKPTRKTAAPGEWSAKTFCITGSTEINRTALIKIISDAGGTWKSSVVNGLDYLIVADVPKDKADWSVKLQAADKKGVRVISEAEALKMAKYA